MPLVVLKLAFVDISVLVFLFTATVVLAFNPLTLILSIGYGATLLGVLHQTLTMSQSILEVTFVDVAIRQAFFAKSVELVFGPLTFVQTTSFASWLLLVDHLAFSLLLTL